MINPHAEDAAITLTLRDDIIDYRADNSHDAAHTIGGCFTVPDEYYMPKDADYHSKENCSHGAVAMTTSCCLSLGGAVVHSENKTQKIRTKSRQEVVNGLVFFLLLKVTQLVLHLP